VRGIGNACHTYKQGETSGLSKAVGHWYTMMQKRSPKLPCLQYLFSPLWKSPVIGILFSNSHKKVDSLVYKLVTRQSLRVSDSHVAAEIFAAPP
jgi:hypothetical protein